MSGMSRNTVGHSGKCTVCQLCLKSNAKIKHLNQMNVQPQFKEAYTWLKEHQPTINDSACICLPCVKQIQRNHSKEFTPRWLPKPPVPLKLCNLEHCKCIVYAQTTLVTVDELEKCLKQKVNAFTVTSDQSNSIGLCRQHYMLMYNTLHAAPCDSCLAKPKKGETFNRHCSSPEVVNEYLSHVSAENSQLTSASTVCLTCYKYFKSIIAEVMGKGKPLVPTVSLGTILAKLMMEIESIRGKGETIDCGEFYEMVLCMTGKTLTTKMKSDEAMLLSTLYQLFIRQVHTEANNYTSFDPIGENKIPQKRWVLSRLYRHFGEVLSVACRHFRYGTVLYHKNCDLVSAVSAALGRSKTDIPITDYRVNVVQGPSPQTSLSVGQECACDCSIETQIENVSSYLNDKVHKLAKALITSYQNTPQLYATFDTISYQKLIDPVLLHFIEQLTQTVRTRRRKLFQNEAEVSHTKQVRQLYILSLVLFCTNTHCSMPFHTLLTETTLCHGGTQELVKILNRVGAIASIDTHQRLATQVVQERIAQGVLPHIDEKALSIVSVDNIDILQPHAFVSCTDATRSWHGTSVQCMQPLPLTGILEVEDINVLHHPHSRKHYATSPTASPVPTEKSKRRRRTLTELFSPHTSLSVRHVNNLPNAQVFDSAEYSTGARSLQLDDFRLSTNERRSMNIFQEDIFRCMLLKYTPQQAHQLPGLQSLINCIRKQTTSTEESRVAYIEISSERADSKPTLVNVLGKLYQTFVVQQGQKWLLVVGDAKTYDLIKTIRSEYGDHMKWLIPWPGDWHILLNYQKALMKAYAGAGLTKLGEISQHRSETLTSLIQCSNFRRTHNFLVQTMEAFYRFFLSLYMTASTGESHITTEEGIHSILITMVSKFSLLCDDAELETFRSEIQMAISSTGLCFDDFHTFMKQLSQKQDTIHFWYQFVTVDIMAYFSLFIAIRYRNWDLRNCSIKLLAPVFSAFDRPIYQSLIPRHISDVLSLPDCVHKHLQRGSFCVRLSASEWHGVALDECHEMKINKDAKMAVTRPSVHKMEHLSNHLPFRAACVNNLTQQLFPERDKRTLKFSHSPTSKDKKTSLNVERMLEAISNHGLFHSAEENNGLWNFLQSQKASSEQAHDLLKFREIGQTGYEAFILSKLLNIPSTAAPVRRKRLNTFTTSQAERRRVKQVDKEAKISQRYLKKTVVWLAEHGGEGADLNTLLGPPSPTPRALMDNDGLPYKGTKSSTTAYLERRYTNPPVIINSLPTGWIPHSVILEGMFLIQMSPLPSMNCMEEYVKLLLSRYVRPHFYAGVIEVHVVFDVAGLQRETPKEIEQMRRDGTMNNASTRHHCIDFCSDLLVPEKWRTVLGCRKCKKSLTSYIADDMLRLICNDRSFRSHQTFIANIGGQAYATIGQSRQLRTDLSTNADEADLRVWLHCQRACGVHKLLYSPDTDVYHIGLSIVGGLQECDVIIQLSKYTDDRARYLHMTNMITALTKDPDLSEIHIQTRPQVLQSIYVATGCDYTSFFNGLGKVTFLATFFQHAAFIAGRNSPPGTIGEMSLDLQSNAKFSFLRLIGCAYL